MIVKEMVGPNKYFYRLADDKGNILPEQPNFLKEKEEGIAYTTVTGEKIPFKRKTEADFEKESFKLITLRHPKCPRKWAKRKEIHSMLKFPTQIGINKEKRTLGMPSMTHSDKNKAWHTGWIQLDFDHILPKKLKLSECETEWNEKNIDWAIKKLKSYYYEHLEPKIKNFDRSARISPSYDGIKIFIKINGITKYSHEKYYDHFMAVFPQADSSCSNFNRLCYYTNDIIQNSEGHDCTIQGPLLKSYRNKKTKKIAKNHKIKRDPDLNPFEQFFRDYRKGYRHNAILDYAVAVKGNQEDMLEIKDCLDNEVNWEETEKIAKWVRDNHVEIGNQTERSKNWNKKQKTICNDNIGLFILNCISSTEQESLKKLPFKSPTTKRKYINAKNQFLTEFKELGNTNNILSFFISKYPDIEINQETKDKIKSLYHPNPPRCGGIEESIRCDTYMLKYGKVKAFIEKRELEMALDKPSPYDLTG